MFVDDIISSGRTMIEATRLISAKTTKTPVCVAVHGIFADNSDLLLAKAGARVVTSDSIAHATNAIHIEPLLTPAIRELMTGAAQVPRSSPAIR